MNLRTMIPGLLVIGLAACGSNDADPVTPTDTCPPGWNTSAFFQSATPETIRACVSAGESVNARAPDGRTPLHFAASNTDDPAVIRALLDAGARPDARSGEDFTVLCVAAAGNENPAVIRALLDGGAYTGDLCGHISDAQHGITPLHLAVQFNANPDVAEVLIQAGADVNARPLRRGTPLCQAARQSVNVEMIRLLLRHGAETGDAARCATSNEDPAAMQILIEAGADLAGVLHNTIFNPTTLVTEIVIAAGADLNGSLTFETQEGATEGSTPLHWAARRLGQLNLEAVRLLLVAGADPNLLDSAGRTPLDWAEERRQTSLAALLREFGGKPGG